MRQEQLQETEILLDVEVCVELDERRAGTLLGVRSLISTSVATLLGRAAGLAAVGVADCCSIAA
jgi:hypothetical protein